MMYHDFPEFLCKVVLVYYAEWLTPYNHFVSFA